jgi:hypothetical protein
MCDDVFTSEEPEPAADAMSRRHFIHGSAAAVAAAAVLGRVPGLPLRSAARDVSAAGARACSMAMHLHASFSEQNGSMDSHLYQAVKNAVDVVWWTDHDHRMAAIGYRKTVHFTSLTAESGAPGEGKPWIWTRTVSGPLSSTSAGGIVTSPSSPNDPVAGGSLHLSAKSTSTSTAKLGYFADCHPAGWNYRGNLTGQSLSIDVRVSSGWSRGYLELLIATSHHEAIGGRPAGNYTLSYRFLPPGQAAGRSASGDLGVVRLPVSSADHWQTVTITPSADIAALWPDLDNRDFALWGLTLSAASTGDTAAGYVDYLRFNRKLTGEVLLDQQRDMVLRLAAKYPSVVQRQGLEVSLLLPHLNWFGGAVAVPSYGSTNYKTYLAFLRDTVVPQIHASGGLVSYNHPYGYDQPALLPVAQQDAMLRQLAPTLLPTGTAPAALGADILEVGYKTRQGVDLAHHIALWDVLSRNAVFLTGNATSDDHAATNWRGMANNWFTSVWAASTAEADLLAPLAAGRAWCASLSGYRGSMDLMVDGTCPMGSVSVSSVTSRKLTATATQVPAGGSLQILRGTVDYAGAAAPAANTTIVGTYTAAQLSAGSVTTSIDTSKSRFVRTQVLDGSGKVVGVSNPVWLLRSAPPGGVPRRRAC